MQFFADEDDLPLLVNRLNEDPELAFIVRDDPVPVYTRARRPVAVAWWTEGREFLASSHFSWIENRYALIGAPAHPATVKWWARFGRWMRANTTPLKVHKQVTFLAFPSALRRLQSGIAYYANQWDLGPAIASSKPSTP